MQQLYKGSLLALATVLTLKTTAQLGPLDLTFATDGIFESDLGGGTPQGRAVALQPDGKIVMAGRGNLTGMWFDWLVIRLTTDGVLDTTFSGDGIASSGWSAANDQAQRVEIQSDGKILIAGFHYDGAIGIPMVVRL